MKDLTRVIQADVSRRSLLTNLSLMGLGVAGVGATAGAISPAAAEDQEYYSPGGLRHHQPEEAGTLPRAVFEHPRKLDLNDPHHLKLARLKVFNALDGSTTYFYTVARHVMLEPGKPPYPILAELELTTIFLERREGMSDTEAVIRANFTRAPLHHSTFELIDSYYNPYLGREMPMKYTLFVGSGFEVDLAGDAPADPILQSDEPHYRIGDDIAFIMFDPLTQEGPRQPRVDMVTWRTNYEELINRKKKSVEAEYSYSATMRASDYAHWSGVEQGDPAQMLTSRTGRKVTALEDLPQECHDLIVSKFPDRV